MTADMVVTMILGLLAMVLAASPYQETDDD